MSAHHGNHVSDRAVISDRAADGACARPTGIRCQALGCTLAATQFEFGDSCSDIRVARCRQHPIGTRAEVRTAAPASRNHDCGCSGDCRCATHRRANPLADLWASHEDELTSKRVYEDAERPPMKLWDDQIESAVDDQFGSSTFKRLRDQGWTFSRLKELLGRSHEHETHSCAGCDGRAHRQGRPCDCRDCRTKPGYRNFQPPRNAMAV